MKRAILLALICLPMLACQSLNPFARSGHLDRLLASGEIRVGLSADLPPLNMKNKAGEIIGFEVDLVEALARSMGLTARYVERPFAELLPALEAGEVDMVISGMTITPERNARAAFAGPYFISGTSLVTRSSELASVKDPEQLNDPSRTFAALASSTSADFVSGVMPKAALVTTANYEAAIQKLIAGEVDALVADFLVCSLAVWRNPEAELQAIPSPFTIEPLGIALPADAPLFLNLVQNYLNTLQNTGLLARYKARWLGDGSWVTELP